MARKRGKLDRKFCKLFVLLLFLTYLFPLAVFMECYNMAALGKTFMGNGWNNKCRFVFTCLKELSVWWCWGDYDERDEQC